MGRITSKVDLYNARVISRQSGSYSFGGSLTSTTTALGVEGAGLIEFIDVWKSTPFLSGSTLVRVLVDDEPLISATYSFSSGVNPTRITLFAQVNSTSTPPIPYKSRFSIISSNPTDSSTTPLYATVTYRSVEP